MSTDSHRELRELLGTYALGMLDEEQRIMVSAHLDGCAECRAELDFVTPAAELLPLAEADRVERQPAPPSDLGERILTAIGQEQQDQRRWGARRGRVLAGVAGVAVLLVGFGFGMLAAHAWWVPEPPPMETVPTVAHEPEIEVEAELIPHTWGMEVRLTGMGFSDGESYRAIVLDEEGEEYPAGEFIGVGEEEMVCNLNSSLLREDAEGFEVVDSAGEQVLVSSF